MKIQSLGHVVLKVRDRAKAEAFYNGILGLPVATRSDALKMTFFSLGGTHHDFAIAEDCHANDECKLDPHNGPASANPEPTARRASTPELRGRGIARGRCR